MGLSKKEALQIVKENAHKYKSFKDFRIKHPKGFAIETMTRRGLSPEKVYSFFGGRKTVQLSKKEWKKYLSKNASKYATLRLFLDNDKNGSKLKNQIYITKSIDSKWVHSFWNNEIDYGELRIVHPAFDKMLKSKKISFEKEVWISKKSRVDRVLTFSNGNKVLVELKSDNSCQTFTRVKNQKDRYHNTAKRKYKKKYCMTYVVSPKGTYGLSFKEFWIDVERFRK